MLLRGEFLEAYLMLEGTAALASRILYKLDELVGYCDAISKRQLERSMNANKHPLWSARMADGDRTWLRPSHPGQEPAAAYSSGRLWGVDAWSPDTCVCPNETIGQERFCIE